VKLSIAGYKSIAEQRTIEIGGLTILAGANSSGKSSFMQPLLLIKQTLENDFDAGALLLDGFNVKLSDSSQIRSKVPATEQDRFTVGLVDEDTEVLVSYQLNEKTGIAVESVYHKSSTFRNGIRLHLDLTESEIDNIFPDDHIFLALAKQLLGKGEALRWKVVRNRCFLELMLRKERSFIPFDSGFAPCEHLAALATKLIHVPGIRGNPERSYRAAATDASSYPGSFEKYVASIIHHWQTDKAQHTKIGQLQSQLQALGLASAIAAEKLNDTRLEIRISRHNGYSSTQSDLVNIADVGFGVSQILPVLVALLVAREDQLVYIEEPELHLHPRAQFALAKVIASAVSERNIKVVIETHSSILIRGVQILVVKGELNPEQVSLNWFTQDPATGQTDITEAKLDKLGAFGDWPEDFDAVTLDVEKQYLDAVEQVLENEV
jgi:predicted ATPase